MKKALILSLLGLVGLGAVLFNMACNATSPASPNNFQTPLQTIAAINPTWSLTPTSTSTFTPTNTFTPTITFTPTNTGTPTPYSSGVSWGGFQNPSAIALANSGSNSGLFVADMGNNQVKKYTLSGTLVTAWGDGGKGHGAVTVTKPGAVAVDGSGNLYVVGGFNGVNKYDPMGNLINQFTSVSFATTFTVGINSVTFTGPQGVAVDASGNIYVGDSGNNRVVKLNSAGAQTAAITIIAAGSTTQTAAPYGVAVDNNGNVAAVANDNNIHYYTSSGAVITVIPGTSNSAFSSPKGIAFDSGNNLYVADTGYNQVEEFANWGLNTSPVAIFNNNGSLRSPTGVAVDTSGNIYVTDAFNNNVVKFLP